MTKVVLDGQSFVGPFDSSTLEPFYDTLRDTVFPLDTISIMRSPLRLIDGLVTVSTVDVAVVVAVVDDDVQISMSMLSLFFTQATFLEARSFLTNLEVMDCGLTAFMCKRLGEAIGTNRMLKSVVFDFNRFGGEGAAVSMVWYVTF